MKDLRHLIDLNPNAGDSWQGLTRQQAKTLATALILVAIWLMFPPGIPPDPSDVINLYTAKFIINTFGIESHLALTMSFTIVPWLIFLIGIWIYPANSKTIFNGYMNKLKRLVKKVFKNPVLLFVMILIGFYVFQIYEKILMSLI